MPNQRIDLFESAKVINAENARRASILTHEMRRRLRLAVASQNTATPSDGLLLREILKAANQMNLAVTEVTLPNRYPGVPAGNTERMLDYIGHDEGTDGVIYVGPTRGMHPMADVAAKIPVEKDVAFVSPSSLLMALQDPFRETTSAEPPRHPAHTALQIMSMHNVPFAGKRILVLTDAADRWHDAVLVRELQEKGCIVTLCDAVRGRDYIVRHADKWDTIIACQDSHGPLDDLTGLTHGCFLIDAGVTQAPDGTLVGHFDAEKILENNPDVEITDRIGGYVAMKSARMLRNFVSMVRLYAGR